MSDSSKINYSDVFDSESFKTGIQSLLDLIAKIKAEAKISVAGAGTSLSGNKGNTSADMKQAAKDIELVNKAQKTLTATEEAEIRVRQAAKEQIKNREMLLNAEAKALIYAEGSMKKLNAELEINRMKYRNLSQAQRDNKDIGGKLLTTIQQQDSQIKKLDATLGNHQRNVGNYKSALEGLKSQFGTIFTAAGLAGLGVNLISNAFSQLGSFIKNSYLAYEEAEKQERVLNFALGERENVTKDLISYSEQLQNASGVDDETIQSQEAYLALQGRSTAQIKKTIQAAIDFSKATGEDFESAVKKLDGSMEGILGKMAKYDSRLKQLTPEQLKAGAAIEILGEKFAGVAAKSLTLTDRLGVLWDETKENVGDFTNSLAESIIYVVTFGQAFNDAGDEAEEMGKKVKKTGEEIQKEILLLSNLQATTAIIQGDTVKATELATENYQSYLETLTSVEQLQKLITEEGNKYISEKNKISLLTNAQQNKLIKERIEALKDEQNALGIIERLKSKISEYETARDKALTNNEIARYNKLIEETQKQLDALLGKTEKVTKATKEKIKAETTFYDILTKKIKEYTDLQQQAIIDMNPLLVKSLTDELAGFVALKKGIDDYQTALNDASKTTQTIIDTTEHDVWFKAVFGMSYDEIEEKRKKTMQDNEDAQKKIKEDQKDFFEAVEETSTAIIESYEKRSESKQANIDKELEASKKYEDQLRELAKTGIEGATENLAFEQKKQAEIEAKKLQQQKTQEHLKLSMAAITAFGKIAETDPDKALVKTITEITKLLAYINTIPAFAEGVIEFKGKGTTKSDSNIVKLSDKESVIKAEATALYKPQLKAMNELRYNPFDYINIPKDRMQKDNSDYGVIKEIQVLNETLKNKTEYSIDINSLTHEIVERVQRGNTIVINKHKPKGLF